MVKKAPFVVLLSLFLVFSTGCDESVGCDDCGGTLDEGYLFDYVSTEDMQELGAIDDIEIGACIRFKLDGSDFDLDNVAVVDDCCCETQGY
jgi:hypothetical protein